MGHEAHVDNPGEIAWFVGHGPATVVGPCPHADCPHTATGVVAWGPDLERYELVVCDVDDGCAGTCRGWVAQEQEGRYSAGRLHHLMQFVPGSEVRSTRENRRVPV
jgi:hypothetical protein